MNGLPKCSPAPSAGPQSAEPVRSGVWDADSAVPPRAPRATPHPRQRAQWRSRRGLAAHHRAGTRPGRHHERLPRPDVGAAAPELPRHHREVLVGCPPRPPRHDLATQTIRGRLGALAAFFVRLDELDLPDAPPRTPILRTDLPIKDDPLPRFIDDPASAKLLAAARAHPDPFTRVAIELLARTGLRQGELLDVGKLLTDRYVPLHPQLKTLLDKCLNHRGRRRARTSCSSNAAGGSPPPGSTPPSPRWPRPLASVTSPPASCARPVELDCHFESVCETCTFFVTTIEFRPTLKRQRDDAAAKGEPRANAAERSSSRASSADSTNLPLDDHPHNHDLLPSFFTGPSTGSGPTAPRAHPWRDHPPRTDTPPAQASPQGDQLSVQPAMRCPPTGRLACPLSAGSRVAAHHGGGARRRAGRLCVEALAAAPVDRSLVGDLPSSRAAGSVRTSSRSTRWERRRRRRRVFEGGV